MNTPAGAVLPPPDALWLADPLCWCSSMTVVTIQRPEDLADLIRRAKAGEEIVIAAGSSLLARLLPLEPAAREPGKGPRQPASLMGRANLADAFLFGPLPEGELRLWDDEGGGPQ
jgi:antitoxin (DNA-binding transcriptional repressor) of toxin-antitoxin stability system